MGACTMSVTSGERREIASAVNVDMMQHRFSPNQRWISFITIAPNERSVARVYLMPAAGGAWIPVTDGAWYDDKPRWAADGRTLYFVSNRGGRSDVWGRHIDPETGRPLGDIFRVSSFEQGRQIISPYLDQLEMNITATRIFLPMYEATGQVWILDNIDK